MLNHVTIMGRLTKDPELRRTDSGTAVTSFSIACDRDFKSDVTVDFFNIVAFGKTAEFVDSYFTKGKDIVVSGKLQTRSWTAKDGAKKTVTEIVADRVYFCGGKTSGTDGHSAKTAGDFEPLEGNDDDLPF